MFFHFVLEDVMAFGSCRWSQCFFTVISFLHQLWQNAGYRLHGGAITSLVDMVGSAAIFATGAPYSGVSVEINVTFMDAVPIDVSLIYRSTTLQIVMNPFTLCKVNTISHFFASSWWFLRISDNLNKGENVALCKDIFSLHLFFYLRCKKMIPFLA